MSERSGWNRRPTERMLQRPARPPAHPSEPYRDFAAVYDAWQKLYPRPFAVAMAPRIAAAISKHQPPVRILADVACGTGTLLHHWTRTYRGWTLYGTDRSPAMIRSARRAARAGTPLTPAQATRAGTQGSHAGRAGAATPPRFKVQDLLDLDLPSPAGVITCIFDSLNHVTRASDLQRIFHNIRRNLAPGGIFFFDLVHPDEFADVFTGYSILEGEDLYAGVDSGNEELRGVLYGTARFSFFRRRGERWRRVDFEVRERCWKIAEIRAMLAYAGLKVLDLVKADPYDADEYAVPRAIWTCRRP